MEIVHVKAFKEGSVVNVATFLTQSKHEDAYQAAFKYLKDEMGLNPQEIICDPQGDLTSGVIKVFGVQVKYKTCSYYVNKWIKQRAERIGLLENKKDQNI